MSEVEIRKARLGDVEEMHRLINYYANRNLMLPRTKLQLYEALRAFTVAVNGADKLVGCGALHFYGPEIAEIRSLAVAEAAQGGGIGRRIVEALIEEARDYGIKRVFAFTLSPEFFSKLGFVVVPHTELPEKVFLECLVCPKRHNCNEIAMLRDLDHD